MEPAEPTQERPEEASEKPLAKGRLLTRDESVELMYARFDKTFEALAK